MIAAQSPTPLSLQDFNKLRDWIRSQYGISWADQKKPMLESRLHKRLAELGLPTFAAYCQYLKTNEGKRIEHPHLLNAITTNTTDFFREPAHFDYFVEEVLPQFQNDKKENLRIWSAACSSGEEVYTLAILAHEYRAQNRNISFSTLGTDIAPRVLERARRGIYEHQKILVVPPELRYKYFLRGKGEQQKYVKVKPVLQQFVQFSPINLMQQDYGFSHLMDVIFCRNVFIYFNQPTRQTVLTRLCRYLRPGGYLFLGHAETTWDLDVPLRQVRPAVYQKLTT